MLVSLSIATYGNHREMYLIALAYSKQSKLLDTKALLDVLYVKKQEFVEQIEIIVF